MLTKDECLLDPDEHSRRNSSHPSPKSKRRFLVFFSQIDVLHVRGTWREERLLASFKVLPKSLPREQYPLSPLSSVEQGGKRFPPLTLRLLDSLRN